MACQVEEEEGSLFTGRSCQCQRSPGRRTPCRGSHPGPVPAHKPPRWQLTQTPCCGHWPAGRKPGWSLAEGASWWRDKDMAEWGEEDRAERRRDLVFKVLLSTTARRNYITVTLELKQNYSSSDTDTSIGKCLQYHRKCCHRYWWVCQSIHQSDTMWFISCSPVSSVSSDWHQTKISSSLPLWDSTQEVVLRYHWQLLFIRAAQEKLAKELAKCLHLAIFYATHH